MVLARHVNDFCLFCRKKAFSTSPYLDPVSSVTAPDARNQRSFPCPYVFPVRYNSYLLPTPCTFRRDFSFAVPHNCIARSFIWVLFCTFLALGEELFFPRPVLRRFHGWRMLYLVLCERERKEHVGQSCRLSSPVLRVWSGFRL
jgi:hypothetical protein